MLIKAEVSEGILYVEACFKNRVDVIAHKADSVVRIEVFWTEESRSNLKEDLTI